MKNVCGTERVKRDFKDKKLTNIIGDSNILCGSTYDFPKKNRSINQSISMYVVK